MLKFLRLLLFIPVSIMVQVALVLYFFELKSDLLESIIDKIFELLKLD